MSSIFSNLPNNLIIKILHIHQLDKKRMIEQQTADARAFYIRNKGGDLHRSVLIDIDGGIDRITDKIGRMADKKCMIRELKATLTPVW